MKPIIEINKISKKYRISHSTQPYLTFRESMIELFKRSNSVRDEFWALKDVSFSVAQGDTIGIIGKNGAGKSTLLKILSRITPPTQGKIICRGRIASLLEVGTGFHPELTGRENIFLNGSILGLKKTEIIKKFDEIVDFSGVEKFLDTPLKHYSSGMQLRLAFAVAANLEPEVMVIDEVLAVGDAEFQKKCLGKMSDVAKSGRTIFFVSHNMGAVQLLCNRAVLLDKGELKFDSNVNDVINQYQQITLSQSNSNWVRKGDGNILFTDFYLTDEKGIRTETFFMGDEIHVHFQLKFKIDARTPVIGVELRNNLEEPIAHIINEDSRIDISNCKEGDTLNIDIKLPDVYYSPSRYYLSLWAGSQGVNPSDYIYNCMHFDLVQGDKVYRKSPYSPHIKFYQRSEWFKKTG